MPWYILSFVGFAVVSVFVPPVIGQEPVAKPKAKIELLWVEVQRVEGLTQENGFRSTCDPDSYVYPHKKPALVLTAADVTEVSLVNHDFSKSGLSSENYNVTLHLTKEARNKLAAACEDDVERSLTVAVDGKYWGVSRYAKGRASKGVAPEVCAATFLPSVGYFTSKADAQRLVDAFK